MLYAIFSVYESIYCDCPTKEFLGVFSSVEKINEAIQKYKALKIKYGAEILLKDTIFNYVEVELDDDSFKFKGTVYLEDK
jgi:hypothetical protein